MQITMCLLGRNPRPADHFSMPHQGRTHLAPASSTSTGSPGPGEPAQLPALAVCLQSSGRGNQTTRPCHFPQMCSSKNGRSSGSEFKLLFTGSQYFHKIILLGQGEVITQIPGGKMWLSGDGGMEMTEQGSQNRGTTPTHLKIHIHLFISQISVKNLPCAPGTPYRCGEAEIKGEGH